MIRAALVVLASAAAFAPLAAEPKTAYRIGPEDVLHIVVWKNADLSATVPVRPDGMISLPLLAEVPVEGLTPLELQERLREKLSRHLPSPQVFVMVTEVHSVKVSILGKVRRPDRYELRRPTTVLDALALAGGLESFSSPEQIAVFRRVSGVMKKLPFSYHKATTLDGNTENFLLESGDIIVVP